MKVITVLFSAVLLVVLVGTLTTSICEARRAKHPGGSYRPYRRLDSLVRSGVHRMSKLSDDDDWPFPYSGYLGWPTEVEPEYPSSQYHDSGAEYDNDRDDGDEDDDDERDPSGIVLTGFDLITDMTDEEVELGVEYMKTYSEEELKAMGLDDLDFDNLDLTDPDVKAYVKARFIELENRQTMAMFELMSALARSLKEDFDGMDGEEPQEWEPQEWEPPGWEPQEW